MKYIEEKHLNLLLDQLENHLKPDLFFTQYQGVINKIRENLPQITQEDSQ